MLPDPSDLVSFLATAFKAVASKQYTLLLALIVVALVFVLRKFAGRISPKLDAFLHSDPGGALLALLVAFATALSGAGGAITTLVLVAALKTAIGAMGGFSLLNKFLLPLIVYLFPGKGVEKAKEIETKAVVEAPKVVTGNAAEDLNAIK